MSATELARHIGVPPNRITQILRAQRGMTGDTAIRLGHWFGMSPEFWMNLQTGFEIAVARQAIGEKLLQLPRRHAA